MNTNRKLINAFLVSTMVLSGLAPVASAQEAGKVDRLYGDTRVETSIAVSNEVYETAENVVIAGFKGEVDALTGTMLASLKDAPLLIVNESNTKDLKAKIASLGAKNVYLLGGETIISADFENELKEDYAVERVSGDLRYDTAVEVAKKAGDDHGHIFLTNDGVGKGSLADALAVGPVSGSRKKPVLLTGSDSLPAATLQAIKDFGVTTVTVIGGKVAVSENVEAELTAAGVTTIERIAGDYRWDTAELIAAEYFAESTDAVITNDGVVSYADALMAGYLGAKKDAPVLLTPVNGLRESTKNYLGEKAMHAYVLGGEKVVSKTNFETIEEIIAENAEEEALEVESVSAINAKTIEVTFNNPVEDTSKATVELMRGTFKQNATVKWAEDNKSVQLVGAGNFQAGDYTVNVKGLTEEALTGSVKIEAQKVSSIEILSEDAVLSKNPNGLIPDNSDITATAGYVVKDQYGTDITKTTTLSTNGTNVEAKEGTITIDKLGSKKIGDLVPVVLIHSESATTVSKTLKLSAAATVSDVEVEGVYDAKGKKVELKDNTKAEDVFLVLNLKDQYNNDIKPGSEGTDLDSVIVTNTNPLVTKVSDKVTVKSIDGKNRFVVKFEAVDAPVQFKGGSAELLFIKTMDGKTFKHTVNVAETQTTDAVTVGKPEYAIVDEDVLVPLTVMDKEGNVITDKKLLADGRKGIQINAKPVAEKNFTVKDGQVYYNIGPAETADKYETVTVQTSTFKIDTVTYKVSAKAKPVAVRGFKSPLVLTGNKTIEFKDLNIEDQYGRTMTAEKWAAYAGTAKGKYDFAVKADENSKILSASGKKITTKGNNGAETVTVYLGKYVDAKAPEEGLVLEEVKNSAVEQRVRVTDGKEYTGYEIAPIDKVEAGVEQTFTVNGLLGDGKVSLASNEYTAKVTGGSGKVTVSGNKFTVNTGNLKKVDGKEVDTEFTLTVTINATGKVYEETFTVSPDAKEVQEFFFTTEAKGGKANYDDAKALTDVVVHGGSYTVNSSIFVEDSNVELNIATLDQYNNKNVVGLAADTVNIVPEDVTKVDITGNGTADAKATLENNVKEAKLTVTVKVDGATKVLNVTLKSEAKSELVYDHDVSVDGTTIDTMLAGTINLTGTTDQNVTVNAPNATVNNNATVTDGATITIIDVSGATWNEMANGNSLVFNDPDVGTALNIEGKPASLEVNSAATVNVASGATVGTLTVTKPGSKISLQGNATVTTLTLDEAADLELSEDSTITNDIVSENEDVKKAAELVRAKATKKAGISKVNFTEEELEGKTIDSINKAGDLLAQLKEDAKGKVEEAETLDAVNKITVDKTAATDLLVDILVLGDATIDAGNLSFDLGKVELSKAEALTGKQFFELLDFQFRNVGRSTDNQLVSYSDSAVTGVLLEDSWSTDDLEGLEVPTKEATDVTFAEFESMLEKRFKTDNKNLIGPVYEKVDVSIVKGKLVVSIDENFLGWENIVDYNSSNYNITASLDVAKLAEALVIEGEEITGEGQANFKLQTSNFS